MMEWLIVQATTGGVIPQGVIDALIGLCALGVSSLFGFTYAIQRRLTKMETNMEQSQKDREHLWVEMVGMKNNCNNHLTKNTELSTTLAYIAKVIDELKADIKDLKKEFNK
ncbi:MAG: hypothetical protein ABFE07_18770 [Armatimonadia bacterium]